MLEYQEQLDALYDRRANGSDTTSASDTGQADTASAEPVTAACDAYSITLVEDLIEAERRLAPCSAQWEDLLFQVQSQRQQATTEADIAHWQNFLGIVDYYMGDYGNAVIEHNRALTRYRTLGDAVGEGRSLYYAGRSYLRDKRAGDANSFLSQAQRVGINSGDARTVALVSLLYGDQAYNSRDMDEALDRYDYALQQLESLEDSRDMISTMLRLAQIHDERSDFDQAVDFYNRVADLADTAGDSAGVVRARIGLARDLKYFGHYAEALDNANAAFEAASDDASIALARAEKADVARLMEDYDAARDILQINANQLDCVTGDQIRLYSGYYYIAVGQTSNALEQFRPLLEPETCDQRAALTVADAQAGVADVQLQRRRSDPLVLDAINAAIREYDNLNYPRGYKSARIQMANYSFFLRNYDDAERWLSTAEHKAQETNDLKAQSDVAMVRVEISIDRGRYSDALSNLESASDLYNRLEFAPGLSATLEQRLRIYLDQARYDEAISLINYARENYSSISVSFDSRVAFYQGRYYEQIGQTELALTYYDQALAGFTRAQEILSIVDVQLQRAGIMQQRGQYDEVASLVADLRSVIAEQENNYYLAQIDTVLGDNDVLIWKNSPNHSSIAPSIREAQDYYNTALENYTVVNNVAGKANVYNKLGELELLKINASLTEPERYEGSNEAIHHGLENYRIIGNSLGAANSLYNLGRFSLLSYDYHGAQDFLYQALSEVGNNDPLLRARILTSLGQSYEFAHQARGLGFGVASNDIYQAIDLYTQATQLLAFTYAEIEDKDTQRRFGTQDETLAPYARLLRIYSIYTLDTHEKDAEQALFFSEQSRARSYLTQLQGEDISFGSEAGDSTLTQWQGLREEVVSLNDLLRQITARSGDDAETENIEAEVADRLSQMQALEADMQLTNLQQFTSIQVTDLPSLQAALPEDAMMVIYYVLPPAQTAQTKEGGRILSLLVTRTSIEKVSQLIGDYQQDLLNQVDILLRNHSPVAASKLYTLLFAPLASQIGDSQNLIIVPHGILNYVPFEALTDRHNEPMVTNFNISYVPSATVYTLLRDTVKPSNS